MFLAVVALLFSTSAKASFVVQPQIPIASQITQGQSLNLSVSISSSLRRTRHVVSLRVFNNANQLVAKSDFSNQRFVPGAARLFSMNYVSRASTSPGSYRFDVLIFNSVGTVAFSSNNLRRFTIAAVKPPSPPAPPTTPSPQPPLPPAVSAPIVMTATLTLTSADNGKVFSNYRITSANGDCVKITGATNITFRNSQIGPCAGRGVYITGSSNINIEDSYIHPENLATACCDSRSGVLIENSRQVSVQGNVIAFGESNVQALYSGFITVKGNFLVNPRGPFPRGQNFQAVYSTDILLTQNYSMGSTDTTKYTFAENLEDHFNFWKSDRFEVTDNYFTGGRSPSGCAILIDDTSNSGKVLNNRMYQYGNCGIGVASGTNHTVSGNRLLSTISVAGGANTAIYVWNQYTPACGPVSVTNNQATLVRADGYASAFWDGGGCLPMTNTGNQFDFSGARAVFNALANDAAFIKAPGIPWVPKSCVAKSPFTTANQPLSTCP